MDYNTHPWFLEEAATHATHGAGKLVTSHVSLKNGLVFCIGKNINCISIWGGQMGMFERLAGEIPKDHKGCVKYTRSYLQRQHP